MMSEARTDEEKGDNSKLLVDGVNQFGIDSIDEIWQNQTYIPIKGWGAPFTGPSHYSDLSGEKNISKEDELPDFPAQTG